MPTPMSSAVPDQNDPWAWNAWAQTQDPGLYGWTKSGINGDNLGAFKSELQAVGKWNPEWDAYVNWQGSADPSDYSETGPRPQAPDLSSLNGYQVGSARSSGSNMVNGLFDPSGAQVGGNVSRAGSQALHSGDYRTLGALGAAAFGLGYGLDAAGLGTGTLGTIAPGAAEVAPLATTGQFAMPSLGGVAAPTAAVAGETAGLGAAQVGAMGGIGTLGSIAPGAAGSASLGATAAPAIGSTVGSTALPSAALTGAQIAGGAMDFTSLIGPGLNFLGSAMNANAASSAANHQSDAALQAAQIQAAQRQPWVDAGKAALPQLAAGVAPGGQFNKPFTMADAQNSDAMKEALRAGNENVQNSAAAKSGLLNSNAMRQGQTNAEQIASQYQNQAFNQNLATNNMALGALESLSGTGISQAGQVADAQSNAALVGGGAAAGRDIAQSNIWGSALSNQGNQTSIQNTLARIFSGGGSSVPNSSVPSSASYAMNDWIGA